MAHSRENFTFIFYGTMAECLWTALHTVLFSWGKSVINTLLFAALLLLYFILITFLLHYVLHDWIKDFVSRITLEYLICCVVFMKQMSSRKVRLSTSLHTRHKTSLKSVTQSTQTIGTVNGYWVHWMDLAYWCVGQHWGLSNGQCTLCVWFSGLCI
jgi:hypothetical protein